MKSRSTFFIFTRILAIVKLIIIYSLFEVTKILCNIYLNVFQNSYTQYHPHGVYAVFDFIQIIFDMVPRISNNRNRFLYENGIKKIVKYEPVIYTRLVE